MATNDFLPFATAGGANVLAQADYAVLAARLGGFQSGVAKSIEANKVLRQGAFIAAVLAQFISDGSGEDTLDDGDISGLEAKLRRALGSTATSPIGAASGAKMSVTSASATATLSADEIVVGVEVGGRSFRLATYSQTINLATTGAGGMDTGSAPVSGYVALYAIYNPTSGTTSILATNATSTVAPVIYGGGHMPAGYTASALVSVWRTSSGNQFALGSQIGRKICTISGQALSTAAPAASLTALSIASFVPPNAKETTGVMSAFSGTVQTSSTLTVSAQAGNAIGSQTCSGTFTSGLGTSTNFSTLLAAQQTLYYSATLGSGTGGLWGIVITGYQF